MEAEQGREQVPEHMTDDEWRTLLQLIIKHTGTHHFQQWDTFSLPLPGTPNSLYVQWGMQPPDGTDREHWLSGAASAVGVSHPAEDPHRHRFAIIVGHVLDDLILLV